MQPLRLGIDVGSATVKAVLVDGQGGLRAGAVERHQGAPLQALGRLLGGLAVPDTPVRAAVTGSLGRPVAGAWTAPHVHEVSAMVAAVRARVPRARTILELGGQDAKLAVLDGERVEVTMNDRCAAGTGVTLSRCLFRLGLDFPRAATVRYRPGRSRSVSSKCGVFAETDLCNQARAGVPADDLVQSLADAVVQQCLAVLARGMRLSPDVVLLGGPLAHLPVLVEAFRHRLRERWREQGEEPGEVLLPDVPLLFPALGAAELQARRAPHAPSRTLAELVSRLADARDDSEPRLDRPFQAEDPSGVPDVARAPSLPWARAAGPVFLGVDAGSTICKVVAVDGGGAPIAAASCMSSDPIADARSLIDRVRAEVLDRAVAGLGVTGYGAALLAPVLGADARVLETVAHARSARAVEPAVEVVCDVGGQDVKIVALDPDRGTVRDFRISSQCSAGIGMILESTALELGVPLPDYARRALAARRAPWFGDACGVFLDANRVTFQRQGFSVDEILAGLARALPRVVWSQVMNGSPPARLGRVFVLQGGVQRNGAALRAQVEYLREVVPGARVVVHPFPSEAGAIGAALAAADEVARHGSATSPVRPSLSARVTVESGEALRCHRCASQCPRSVIHVEEAEATTEAVIGNACSDGAELARGSPRGGVALRKRRHTPNLLDEEVRLFFHPRHAGRPLRTLERPPRIGIPRVLSLYRAAPLFRAYLGALGARDVVFSPVTSEALWQRGAGHGAHDPCFPVKVTLAHVEHLLRLHDAGRTLDALFLPHFTHAMTPVRHAVDTASCPVIAGTPSLVKAALGDALERRGIRLLDPTVTITEGHLLSRQLFDGLGPFLGASEAEGRQALRAGMAACAWVDHRLEAGARRILDGLEAVPGRGAVLVVGRPYHSDPGLNHRVGEELQALGYPVITVRSIPRSTPRDVEWLTGLLRRDLDGGAIADPFDVRDLAPEAANSGVVERLFAARVAARHGRFGVVDLSSFKCGQDAPAYAPLRDLLDGAGTPLCTLHDLDETRPVTSLRLRLATFAHAMADRGLGAWT